MCKCCLLKKALDESDYWLKTLKAFEISKSLIMRIYTDYGGEKELKDEDIRLIICETFTDTESADVDDEEFNIMDEIHKAMVYLKYL